MHNRGKKQGVGEQWDLFLSKGLDFRKSSRVYNDSPFIKVLRKEHLLHTKEKVLDCGCGSGEVSFELAFGGYEVTALDFSKLMISQVLEKKRLEEKNRKLKLFPVNADMASLPFGDMTYDLTFSVGAVEHWLDEDERRHVIREMTRVTKLGGKVIIVVPNGKHILYWFWRFIIKQDTPEEIRHSAKSLATEMCEFGLSEVKVVPMGVNKGFSRYLRFKWLRLPVLYASKIIEMLPLFLRLKLTTALICMGKVQ